jgi:Kdo2-lipid IVA lauroyltransferase/acyltransferase
MAWVLKTMAKLVAVLPPGWAKALARHWGWMLAHVVRLRRTYVLATLARCFPEKSKQDRKAIYQAMCCHQALNLMELMRFVGGKEAELGRLFEAHNLARAEAAHARGKGVLILIAHFGNYALLALQVPKLFKYPLSIVAKPLKNKALDELWWGLQAKAGITGIPGRNAYRACVRALRNNELVGFMLDQNRPTGQGVFVDFFGQPASTTAGLALLSAQTGAPVLPVFMRRTPDGRHVLEVLPLLEPPPNRQEETILAHTAAYTKIIEEEIRRYPEQWLWLHKRWKSRPAQEDAEPKGA